MQPPPRSTDAGSIRPERSTSRRSHSSSKLAAKAAARAADSSVTITFSWRVHESVVQLVEPLSTASPSRTTYLWCIRSGTPGTARSSIGSSCKSSGRVAGGGWIAGGRAVSTL